MTSKINAEELVAVLLGQMIDQISQIPPDAREASLLTTTIAFGHVLGYFEGQLALLGYSREARSTLRDRAVQSGKDRTLQDHDALCRSCAAGSALRSEVYPH